MKFKVVESADYNPSPEYLEFFKLNNIDPNGLNYLGSGDFGEAWDIGNDRVLKVTTSKSEFDIATNLVGKEKQFDSFAKIYTTSIIDNDYVIIVELLEIDSEIENMFYFVMQMLDSQSLPIQYIDHLDYDEISEEISEEIDHFIQGISNIATDYRNLGIEASDIRSENMGWGKDSTGRTVLKAFDIEDRGIK